MSLEEVERIMGDTQDSIEYQRVRQLLVAHDQARGVMHVSISVSEIFINFYVNYL